MAHSFDQESYDKQVKGVWLTTVWLSAITVIEVVVALIWLKYMDETAGKGLLNTFFVLMSVLKAYFIVGEFMHINYEKRALTISILAPLFFLIWFIIAFLWEGSEWLALRQFWEM